MLQFNQLLITPDGKKLVIDTQVEDLTYFTDVYIDTITVEVYKSADDFTGVPNGNGVLIFSKTYTDNTEKHIKEIVDIDGVGNYLFFVYVSTSDSPSSDTPCGIKDNMIIGVAYNRMTLYTLGMTKMKSLEECDFNRKFADYMLKLHLIKLCILTGHYKEAITYWLLFFLNTSSNVSSIKSCGCHGRS